jgi:putative transposase
VRAAFLRELIARGVHTPAGLLVVLDGAKGLSAAMRKVFGERVPIQRGQWHTRENVVSDLPKPQQTLWRRKLQGAYAKSTYGEAQRALRQHVKELELHNASAARSLEEGLDGTLTLYRLEVVTKLGISFKTTNLIESVMARVEAKTHRITHWRTSDQQQRWCAATPLETQKQFRKVKGHQHLGLLQAALGGKLSSPRAAA